MVFSSFPVYLDHPNLHQFQQQPADHQQAESGVDNSHLLPPAPAPPVAGGASAGGSIRPGSIVDRARIAKLPLPEAGLKCPRCDSTNTKFCYFNNYSLTQPRHFCKTCRRYWTRGGALRNVPVGGGCRRNKKSKSSSSKTSERPPIANSNIISTNTSSTANAADHFPQSSSQLPLMAALHNLNQYTGGGNIGGFQAQMVATAQMGFGNLGGNDEQWRLPSSNMGGFETGTNLFPFQSEGVEESSSANIIGDQQLIGSSMATSSSGVSQIASVKAEDQISPATGLNLTKQFLVSNDNSQFWGGTGGSWTGFSGLNSSSTSHLL